MRKIKVLTRKTFHKAELKTRFILREINEIDVMFFTAMCSVVGLWGALV